MCLQTCLHEEEKKMIVQKTSVFPSSRDRIFQKLRQLETLQYIARPYASFEPVGEGAPVWEAGSTSSYHFRLFCFIPFGTHTIHIVSFDPDLVRSREKNEHVPVWNHDITMEVIGKDRTRYTDRVEIQAGWKTVLIWLWARAFYAHRQRKWMALLENAGKED